MRSCDVYYKMMGIDSVDNYEQARIKEKELENLMKNIIKKWEK